MEVVVFRRFGSLLYACLRQLEASVNRGDLHMKKIVGLSAPFLNHRLLLPVKTDGVNDTKNCPARGSEPPGTFKPFDGIYCDWSLGEPQTYASNFKIRRFQLWMNYEFGKRLKKVLAPNVGEINVSGAEPVFALRNGSGKFQILGGNQCTVVYKSRPPTNQKAFREQQRSSVRQGVKNSLNVAKCDHGFATGRDLINSNRTPSSPESIRADSSGVHHPSRSRQASLSARSSAS